jgi:hypothetical protein
MLLIQGVFDPSESHRVIFGANMEAFVNKVDHSGMWVTPPPHVAAISGTEATLVVTVKSGLLATSTTVVFDSAMAAANNGGNTFTYKACPVGAAWDVDRKSCGRSTLGLTEEYPGKNCWDIKKNDDAAVSGVYWIKPDPQAHTDAFKVYCEQKMHGGVSIPFQWTFFYVYWEGRVLKYLYPTSL